jgi:hypothetical protein
VSALDEIKRMLRDADALPGGLAPLRAHADALAAVTRPRVQHVTAGTGTVVGVTPDGRLEVQFGDAPYAVSVPPGDVWAAP